MLPHTNPTYNPPRLIVRFVDEFQGGGQVKKISPLVSN